MGCEAVGSEAVRGVSGTLSPLLVSAEINAGEIVYSPVISVFINV